MAMNFHYLSIYRHLTTLVILFLSLVPAPLQAAPKTLTVTGSVTFIDHSDFTPKTLTIPLFDPSLGVLMGITCEMTIATSGNIRVQNDSVLPLPAAGGLTGHAEFLGVVFCSADFDLPIATRATIPGGSRRFPFPFPVDPGIGDIPISESVTNGGGGFNVGNPFFIRGALFNEPGQTTLSAPLVTRRIRPVARSLAEGRFIDFGGNFIGTTTIFVKVTYEYEPHNITLKPPLSILGTPEQPVEVNSETNTTLIVKNEAPGSGDATCVGEALEAFIIGLPERTEDLVGLGEQGPDPLPFSIPSDMRTIVGLCPQQSKEVTVNFSPQIPGTYDAKINIFRVFDLETPIASVIVRGIVTVPEDWDTTWSSVPKPPDVLRPESYKLQWSVKNKAKEPKDFNYNVLIEKEYFRANGLKIEPDWPLDDKDVFFDVCFFNELQREQLEESVNPEDPLTLDCEVSHAWNWIPPRDSLVKQVAQLTLRFIKAKGAFKTFKDLVDTGLDLTDLFKALNPQIDNAPTFKITYTPTIDAESAAPRTITVSKADENIATYWKATDRYAESAFLSIAGGLICLDITKLPVCIGLTGSALSFAIQGNILYDKAVDPRGDFMVLANPGPSIDIPSDGIEDASARRLVALSQELPGIAEAAFLSYTRYLGAIDARAIEWAAVQLNATRLYNQQLLDREEQLGPLYEHLLTILPPRDEDRINQVRNFFATQGFPEEVRALYQRQGFSEQEINDLEQGLAEADDVLYRSVEELPTINKLTRALYAIEAPRLIQPVPGTAQVTVMYDPTSLQLGSNEPVLSAAIELEDGVNPTKIRTDTIRLNGSVPANPIGIVFGDHNGNSIPDLNVMFDRILVNGLLTEAGAHALSITGELEDGTPWGGMNVVKVVTDDVDIMPGDLNGDSKIDMADFQVFQATFGKCEGQAGYNATANFDSDTCITFIDYQTWYGLFTAQQ